MKQLEKRIQRLTREIENHEVTNGELKEEVDTLEVLLNFLVSNYFSSRTRTNMFLIDRALYAN